MNWRYGFKLIVGTFATAIGEAYASWLHAGQDLSTFPSSGYWLVALAAALWWAFAFVDATPKTHDATPAQRSHEAPPELAEGPVEGESTP